MPRVIMHAPRMARRLLNLLTALSLLLCVAVCVLWVRSYWREDQLGYEWSADPSVSHKSEFESDGGEVWVGRKRRNQPPIDGGPGFYWDLSKPGSGGVGWFSTDWEGMDAWGSWGVGVPHWFLTLAFAVPPAVGVIRAHRKRRRLRFGLCRACGYDLRATLDRCPECGSAPAGTKG